MQLQRQRDVIEISIEVKCVKKSWTTSNDHIMAKSSEDPLEKVVEALQDLLSAVQGAKNQTESYGSDLQRIESRLKTIMSSSIRKIQVCGDQEVENYLNELNQGVKVVHDCESESLTSCCGCCKKTPAFAKKLQDLDNSLEKFNQKIINALADQARKAIDATAHEGANLGPAVKNTREKTKSSNVDNFTGVEDNKFQKVTRYPQTEKTNKVSTDIVPSNHAPVESWDSKFHQQRPIKKIEAVSLHSEVPPQLADRQRKLDYSIPGEKNGSMLSNTASSDPSTPPKLPNEVKDRHSNLDLSIPGQKTGLDSDQTLLPNPPEARDSHRKLHHSVPGEKNGPLLSNTPSSYSSLPPTKSPEVKNQYRKHDQSSPGENQGLALGQTLPPKPPEAKGLSEKLEYLNPTKNTCEMLLNNASSSMIVPPKSRESKKEKLKDGFGVTGLAKEPRQDERVEGVQDHNKAKWLGSLQTYDYYS